MVWSISTICTRAWLVAWPPRTLLGGTNYAVGGARAVQHTFPDGVTPYPDLPYQVQLFAMRPGSLPADPNALYVINFGSNDVRAQIEGDRGRAKDTRKRSATN